MLSVVLLASALVVKQDAPLRSGCEASDEVVAQAPAGSPAQIRFAMNGPTETCYKVAVQVGDKTLSGFVPASALKGVEEFTKQIQQAPQVTNSSRHNPETSSSPSLPTVHGSAD